MCHTIHHAQCTVNSVAAEVGSYLDAGEEVPYLVGLICNLAGKWQDDGKPRYGFAYRFLRWCNMMDFYQRQQLRPFTAVPAAAFLVESIESYEAETGISLTDAEVEIAARKAVGWKGSGKELIEAATMPTLHEATWS